MKKMLLQLIVCSLLCNFIDCFSPSHHIKHASKVHFHKRLSMAFDFVKGDEDILIRAFKGEKVERTPVWLMRQVETVRCYSYLYVWIVVYYILLYFFLSLWIYIKTSAVLTFSSVFIYVNIWT